MNILYTAVVALACFGAIGALIASVTSMPVQAANPCNERPWLLECWMKIDRDLTDLGCRMCPWGNIFDHSEWITIPHDWNATISAKHGQNSVTFSVTVPNEVIEAMKTNMTSLEQQNITMSK